MRLLSPLRLCKLEIAGLAKLYSKAVAVKAAVRLVDVTGLLTASSQRGQPRSHRASSPAFALGIARDEERGRVPRSFPLRNRAPVGRLGNRLLGLDPFRAFQSVDV